jgi:hypothetical protein
MTAVSKISSSGLLCLAKDHCGNFLRVYKLIGKRVLHERRETKTYRFMYLTPNIGWGRLSILRRDNCLASKTVASGLV